MKKFLPMLLFLQSCLGWGDIFAPKEKIVGKYYLLENESQIDGYSIYYKYDDNYVGRSPWNSKVLSYGIKDSLLIMKIQLLDSSVNYYVLNMNKDSDFAELKDILTDTIKVGDYNKSWIAKQNLKFKEAK
jgi:hypothetical protein